MENSDVNEDSDSDEEQLLAAAAQWAKVDNTKSTKSIKENQVYSLHLTQLSFEITEYDIRSFFESKGCTLTSVRLVYDRSATEKVFRGVAFIDLDDKKSYEIALSLSRSIIQGRKINVRPVKTKEELGDIVSRTKELVAEKIKASRESAGGANWDEKKDVNSSQKSPKDSGKRKARKKNIDQKFSKKDQKFSKKDQKFPKKDQKSPKKDQKISKKDRNRKAAILMARKRGK